VVHGQEKAGTHRSRANKSDVATMDGRALFQFVARSFISKLVAVGARCWGGAFAAVRSPWRHGRRSSSSSRWGCDWRYSAETTVALAVIK
jgi:hypothetical protein